MSTEDKLHFQAIEIMEKLNEKYKIDDMLSLDEYLIEYRNKFNNEEINEITNLINKF
tara:strand:- start:45 stop:215 length:171 start_codon:yes stop_codon:yes gene_type:complete